MLERTKEEQKRDPTIVTVGNYCSTTWPKGVSLPLPVQKYASVSQELVEELLLKGSRIVIPPSMQDEVLESLHTGHQGVGRCRARANQSVWWPGISRSVEDYVSRCPVCQTHRKPGAEPLLHTPLPNHPWEVVGADLFNESGENYLVVVDYFSRFFELEKLRKTTTQDITRELSEMFAHFGAPAIIRSDNGPQFASAEFERFAKEWGSRHVTSSPYYPQSNGAVERTIQTAKQLLKKSPNIHKALLAHRDTPATEGYSPAELMMGRKIRTNVPAVSKAFQPRWNSEPFRKKDRAYKAKLSAHYDARHRVKERDHIPPHTAVQILSGAATSGTVLQSTQSPRSYAVNTANGITHCTSRHLQPWQPGITVTRGGRKSRPPSRLNL